MKKYQSDLSSLALRIALALIFLVQGFGAIFATIATPSMHFFASKGLPVILDYVVIFLEINAGAFLLLGIFTRLIAMLATIPMWLTTFATASSDDAFSNIGSLWIYPAFVAISTISLALLGSGRFSLFHTTSRA